VKAVLASVLVVVLPASLQAADLDLLPGTAFNVSARCGDPAPVSVQFMGADVSPLVDLPAGDGVPISLARGFYSVAATRRDGSTVEEAQVRVDGPGFRLAFGCATPFPPPESVRLAADRGESQVRFSNTTGDCGDPRRIEFWADGRLAAAVGPGGSVEGRLPRADVVVDVVSGGKRLVSTHLATVRTGQHVFHGCTDPGAPSEGVAIAFQNTTDACPDPLERRHLTLWVDSAPRLGLAPGGQGVAYGPRGRHEIKVLVGLTREKLVSGTREVVAPFRVRYGCGM